MAKNVEVLASLGKIKQPHCAKKVDRQRFFDGFVELNGSSGVDDDVDVVNKLELVLLGETELF